MHSPKHFDKSYNQNVFWTLSQPWITSVSLWAFLSDQMTDFPTLSYISARDIPEHRSIGRYKEYPPLPPWEFACARISGGTSRDKEAPLSPTPTPTGFSYQCSRFLHNFGGKSSKQLTVQNL